MASLSKHWWRLKRSLSRRFREWRLPRGYVRLGTRYGGWWLDRRSVGSDPLLVDCGLGRDISFPSAFVLQFKGRVIGIDPNPQSIEWCVPRAPAGMTIVQKAFWKQAGERLHFHLPRTADHLPKGADGISGSLVASHNYNSSNEVEVTTTSLVEVLREAGREECDVLKMDIEGAEYEVLRAMCDDGSIRRVRQLLIEFHDFCTDYEPADTREVLDRLAGNGFALVHVESHNYILRRSA